jgi:hypothetical protein
MIQHTSFLLRYDYFVTFSVLCQRKRRDRIPMCGGIRWSVMIIIIIIITPPLILPKTSVKKGVVGWRGGSTVLEQRFTIIESDENYF